MFPKRTSPSLVNLCLAAGETRYGDLNTTAQTLSHCIQKAQLFAPFYTPPDHHKKRPPILIQAYNLLESTYEKPKKILSKLFSPVRQKNSQRREAIITVLQVMIHFVDLETLELGFYNENAKFVRLDIEKIAEYAKLSVIRTKRAMSDILKSGYVTAKRQAKTNEDGDIRARPSIRKFSIQFFADLGINLLSLAAARHYKLKKNAKLLFDYSKKKLKKIIKAISENKLKQASVLHRKAVVMVDETITYVLKAFKDHERQEE